MIWTDKHGNHHWITSDGTHWYAHPKPEPKPDPEMRRMIKAMYVLAAMITVIDLAALVVTIAVQAPYSN